MCASIPETSSLNVCVGCVRSSVCVPLHIGEHLVTFLALVGAVCQVKGPQVLCFLGLQVAVHSWEDETTMRWIPTRQADISFPFPTQRSFHCHFDSRPSSKQGLGIEELSWIGGTDLCGGRRNEAAHRASSGAPAAACGTQSAARNLHSGTVSPLYREGGGEERET